MSEIYDYAVVGAGCSGLTLSYHLADQAPSDANIALVDMRTDYQMDTTRPYENMTTIHSIAFIGIAAAAIILNGAGILNTIERQLILLAVLLPFAGIPHGSLDYSIARDMLEPRLRRLWSMTFLTAYLMLMLAVLLGFTVYLTFLHSIRHLLYVADSTPAKPPKTAVINTYIRSLPVMIATIMMAITAYHIMAGFGLALDRMTQVIFIGIASVIYPHVAVIIMAQREEILGNRSVMLSV
jgi:hypothetical protein